MIKKNKNGIKKKEEVIAKENDMIIGCEPKEFIGPPSELTKKRITKNTKPGGSIEKQLRGEEKKPKFRLRANNIFLTYPNIAPGLKYNIRKNFLEKLKKNFVEHKKKLPDKFLVAMEFHFIDKKIGDELVKEKSGRVHLHILLIFNYKIDITNRDIFTIKFDVNGHSKKVICVGNYQAARNKKNVINYCIKEDKNYYTNLTQNELIIGSKEPHEIYYDAYIDANRNIEKANQFLVKILGADALLNIRKLQNNLKIIHETYLKEQELKAIVASTQDHRNFNIPKKIENWLEKNKKKTLFLLGKSGTGKTQLAKSLIVKYLKIEEFLFVRELNQLKDLNDNHEAIIFDDISLESTVAGGDHRLTLLNLFETDNIAAVRLLYKHVTIKPNLIKIITSNNLPLLIRNNAELLRRVEICEINETLFKNPININVNVTNNINNVTNTTNTQIINNHIINNNDNKDENEKTK